ncbi:Mov34/MPN/PAD-1 family protein [Promethearchaeum syntrophicum]|uniref:Mov34/MPN/PAD-1 family protein n=1 Tax=Promethearchaeum syntrophicum TaxID=2594042 RepID=A0A5B9D9K1_9ARCH|nr:Mov34/MPN/PAD-1 family protein [Candidatus Prometheoarchaeum syntrophicum]QEE15276.1 hypothetical protein DSAG12_01101 [Candidatus Prometheoarchaeum syntrophicum]
MKRKKLQFSTEIIHQLFAEIKNERVENCGALIGKQIDSTLFRVTNYVKDDKPIFQSRFNIQRNTNNLYHLINEIVKKKEEEVDYIGEWHSHPNSSCIYSQIDFLTMNMMINDPDYSFLNEIILFIVGKNRCMNAFLFSKSRNRPISLKIIVK